MLPYLNSRLAFLSFTSELLRRGSLVAMVTLSMPWIQPRHRTSTSLSSQNMRFMPTAFVTVLGGLTNVLSLSNVSLG